MWLSPHGTRLANVGTDGYFRRELHRNCFLLHAGAPTTLRSMKMNEEMASVAAVNSKISCKRLATTEN
jgi:hypothetical protein